MLTPPINRKIRTAGKIEGAGRSLSLRRVWYAPDAQAAQGGEKAEGDPTDKADTDQDADQDAEEDDDALTKLSPKQLADMVRENRRKAGSYRTQLRDKEKAEAAAKAEADKTAQEKKAADAKTLEEQGQFKTLYEQQKAELDQLREKAKRADTYEAKLKARNEARIKAIPDSHRKLVPTGYSPEALEEWLDASSDLLKKPDAPDLAPGRKGERKITADPRSVLKRIPH